MGACPHVYVLCLLAASTSLNWRLRLTFGTALYFPGSKGIEHVIQDELKYFLQVVERTKGSPVDIKEQLTQTVSNIITTVIFGERFDYSAEQLANLQITEFRDIFEKTKFIPAIRVSLGNIAEFIIFHCIKN